LLAGQAGTNADGTTDLYIGPKARAA
jgi:hypothetical protein